MATQKSTAEYILDQLHSKHAKVRPMFGEYGLYYDDKVIGFICDDTLYIKITKHTTDILGKDHEAGPCYLGSKDYYIIGDDIIENRETFLQLIQACSKDVAASKRKK